MADIFTGRRLEHFDLLDDIRDIQELLSIQDDLGIKKSNVYFYTKREGEENGRWRQILPTPIIRRFQAPLHLQEGGVIEEAELVLRGIPHSSHSRESLETDTFEGNEERYFVIDGLAYLNHRLVKKYISWDVYLQRYDGINRGDLVLPNDDIIPPPTPLNRPTYFATKIANSDFSESDILKVGTTYSDNLENLMPFWEEGGRYVCFALPYDKHEPTEIYLGEDRQFNQRSSWHNAYDIQIRGFNYKIFLLYQPRPIQPALVQPGVLPGLSVLFR